MQEKQEVSNHKFWTSKDTFFSWPRLLASLSYSLCVRRCSVHGVHRDLIPPNTVSESFPLKMIYEKNIYSERVMNTIP